MVLVTTHWLLLTSHSVLLLVLTANAFTRLTASEALLAAATSSVLALDLLAGAPMFRSLLKKETTEEEFCLRRSCWLVGLVLGACNLLSESLLLSQ